MDKISFRRVFCPYCNQLADLINSSEIFEGRDYGMLWACKPCDAYVGCHKNSKNSAPLGTLANAELRALRVRVHDVFDPLWKHSSANDAINKLSRHEAYRQLALVLRVHEKKAHISMMNEGQCRFFLEYMRKPRRGVLVL